MQKQSKSIGGCGTFRCTPTSRGTLLGSYAQPGDLFSITFTVFFISAVLHEYLLVCSDWCFPDLGLLRNPNAGSSDMDHLKVCNLEAGIFLWEHSILVLFLDLFGQPMSTMLYYKAWIESRGERIWIQDLDRAPLQNYFK